jgi:hypothetical protein
MTKLRNRTHKVRLVCPAVSTTLKQLTFHLILSSAKDAGHAAGQRMRNDAQAAQKNLHVFFRICLTTLSFGSFLRFID